MTTAKTKSVKMTYKALYSYILNTNYRSLSGVIGIIISLMSLVVLILRFDAMSTQRRILFLVLALAFTVINPLLLAFKAFRQYKLSPSYRKPLEYEFSDDGIKVAQGELSQVIKWSDICRILMTKSILAIYTGRMNAFVIPLSKLGDDKGKIIAAVVQFTAEYRPQVSRSLKEYQVGKGI